MRCTECDLAEVSERPECLILSNLDSLSTFDQVLPLPGH